MSYTIEPAPALDERRPVARQTVSGSTSKPLARHRSRTRRAGLVLAAGAFVWSVTTVLFPWHEISLNFRITDLTGFAFQIGVLALLTVVMRTGGIGSSPRTRIALRVEAVLLTLASTWSAPGRDHPRHCRQHAIGHP